MPAPGRAPLPAESLAALIRANGTDADRRDRPAIASGDQRWTHGEAYARSCRFASLFDSRLDPHRPRHVALLAENVPDYLFTLAGAALVGATVVGLNPTRRGEHLLRDLAHTDCQLVIVEPQLWPLLEGMADELPPILMLGDDGAGSLEAALAAAGTDDPGHEPDVDTTAALIFTSGTTSAPKAVICSQRRLLVTGNRMSMIMDLGPDDIGYVCMPLFHSNALMVGWAPSLVVGASVGLARRFSVSGWLADVRRYRASYWSYTGKPLAYLLSSDEAADDADNSLRVAFGNEGSPELVEAFGRRFDVEVIDAYGATEGGIAVNRDVETRRGALGVAPDHVKIVDEAGVERDRAIFDARGRLENAEASVGEIVNTGGVGPFEGYYNNPEANEATTRNGWYWSGDLGYKDDDGYLYFAGRNADWIRVDGENFSTAPIEACLRGHPDVIVAAVYGVPDDQAGDQVMAGLVLRDGAALDGAAFAAWVDGRGELGPKWRPRYVRIMSDPPTTGTNKIVKRTLVTDKWRTDRTGDDAVFVRLPGETVYRRFGAGDESVLLRSFDQHERLAHWDL